MKAARDYFESQSYEVADDSKNCPYDFKCVRGDEVLYVEVKATQTDGSQVILTNGEVEFGRRNPGKMVMFILYNIQLATDGTPSGGIRRIISPWSVDSSALKPISFLYNVPTF